MAYYPPAPPGDDEVIFTDSDGNDWTWGQHRAMEKSLTELEMSDAQVRAARDKLDQTLIEHGYSVDPVQQSIRYCEHCGKAEYVRHEESCPDYLKDLPVTREAGGYKYLTEGFVEVYMTSVPMTDEEALEYFKIVQIMTGKTPVRYIMRREMHNYVYAMLPWQYDNIAEEVLPIERPGE